MERGPPIRSGIPTYHGARPPPSGQDRPVGVYTSQSILRSDSGHSSSWKDKPNANHQLPPRSTGNGLAILNGSSDLQGIRATRPGQGEYAISSRHGRAAQDTGQATQCHSQNKLRPPTGRPVARNGQQVTSSDRNVIGCESTDPSVAQTPGVDFTNHAKQQNHSAMANDTSSSPLVGDTGSYPSTQHNGETGAQDTLYATFDQTASGMECHKMAPISDKDYPIRGTMCPLTNTVAVKRSLGPVDEVSFVFGRPASPSSSDPIVGSPTKRYAHQGMVRCLSPSAGRYIGGHYSARPLSPSSDVLPMKTRMGACAARRVLSPPPKLGVGTAQEARIHHQGGICCEQCNGCLVELKRQALRLMFPDNGGESDHLAQSIKGDNIGDRLTIPESYERWYSRTGHCGICETPIGQLKQEAVAMIQSIQLAQSSVIPANIPSLVGSCGMRNKYSNRKYPTSPTSSSSMHLAAQAQAYLEQNVRAYINPKKYSMLMAGRIPGACSSQTPEGHYDTPGSPEFASDASSSSSSSHLLSPAGQHYLHPQWAGHAHPHSAIITHVPFRSPSSVSSTSSPGSPPPVPSAAVSFFARAAQKLGKKKKRHQSQDQEVLLSFPTNFSDVIRLTPPPAPPCLLRTVGRLQNPGMGKVKVMLKICNATGSQGEQGASFLSPDPRKKQVTVFDPTASGYMTSANRRAGAAVPKMFAFDSVYTPDDSLTELCAGSLTEILQAVVAGADGCLFTYGYSKLGKTYTMTGSDQSPSTLGIMPCAIAWLFKLINEQKDKTGARFSVRVSAVQVTGKEETLRDLLIDIAQGTEATGVGTAPSVYLREDPICGTQLENQSELRAPTAEKAAYYLDAALAARCTTDEDEGRSSNILFTLNVYQYRIEKSNTKAGLPGVAGGRSRLHLIDLGTASKSKDPNNVSLSLSALGNVIMALLNGQRHVPHRDSKIAQLLRDSLGNLSCRTCMIAHVSSAVPHYNETLQVIQLAARIHRMKRRRTKFSSTSSEDSSTDGDVKFRRPYRGLRMGTLREDVLYSSSHSDPDYTSSSEQSCDTVIYLGANGQSLSDRELTDNEGPPRHVPRTNPRLPRRPSGSRSSGDDSDSGRSVHSARSLESRLPIRALMSPPTGVGVAKLGSPTPGSPNPGLVKMGHRMAAHNKLNSDGRTAEPGQASAMWQEKPTKIHCHASQRELAKAIHEKQQPLEGEQWIDGPGAAMYPESSGSEMWVDGPPAFVVQQQPQSVISATPRPPDGQHSSHHHHHRSDPLSRRVASKKVDAEEHWVDGPKEMIAGSNLPQPMHTCIKSDHLSKVPPKSSMSAGVSEKALKQALVKHIMEVKDRPESSMSVDSESSMAVIPAESRPQSFNSSDDQCSNSAPSKDTSDSSTRSGLKQDASSSPMVSSKKQKLHDQKKISASKQSSADSPGPSPALSRKCSKADPAHGVRLQKTQLPGSASPTHRVVQWIKSVSSEQDTPAASHLIASAANISMTDAETNTEHDSDFERMAEENGLRCESDEGANEAVSKDNVNDITCNITAGETSLDSSFDTSMVNRESIYEMEVEEHLEKMRSKDGSHLAADVDNETFSSMSCSNHDDTERDQHCLENESLLLQHTKALTESKQTAQINKHIARSYSKRDISPSDLEKEIEELSRPLLSRKPDGASNPNLMNTFFEEDMLTKGHLGTMPAISLEAMYVQAGHNDSGVDLPTTSSKSCRGVLDNDDSFCDKNVSLHSLSEKSDAFNCSLKQTKTKPPLPSKQSPVLKQSGLPKPSSSSPSRSIYCVAKPTKDSQQKAGANGKHTAVPVVSPSMRNKFSRIEKNSSSSSGVSPLSSATSSPLVSNASKSSSSSPVQKCSSKVPPAFSSSRNSSPTAKDSKGRKKEKEPKGGSSARSKLSDIIHKGKGNDSDSGNDSGIVAHEKKLLSPYATVTKPRTPSHSSSGHGSDNSTISTEVHPGHVHPCAKAENLHGGTSSGYESMLRDSEATCSSSGHDDSGSESSSECKKGSKRKGTRRSRSAPSRSTESSPASSQPSQAGSRSNGPTHKAWVDTRHLHKVKDEPLELKKYDPDEVERLNRRRLDEEKNSKGEDVTGDDESKDRIMMERNGWSFDCKFFMCFSCKSRQRGTDV